MISENNNHQILNLPIGWSQTSLNSIVIAHKGKRPDQLFEKEAEELLPYIDIEAFEKGKFGKFGIKGQGIECSDKDILLVWDGARCGLAGKGKNGLVGSTIMCLTSSSVDNDYLFRYLQFKYSELNGNSRGTGIPHLDPNYVWALQVPLPPKDEQKRIVAKIEALFAESKTIRNAVSKVPILLREFRQSVLTRAFNGQLTKRETHSSDSGMQLLERINEAKKNHNNSKITSGFSERPRELYKIPNNWVWASADDVCWKITDGEHNKPPTVSAGIPLLSAKNVRDGYLDFQNVDDFVTNNVANKCLKRCNPEPGDILIVCVGATIGRVSTVKVTNRFCLQRTVGLLKPVKEEVMTDYIYYFLKSGASQNQINSLIRATAITHFNIAKMKIISIPIPPKEEQKIIVEKIMNYFDLADIVQRESQNAMEKIKSIDQAILAKAFRGELVPQDPNDGPASILLRKMQVMGV